LVILLAVPLLLPALVAPLVGTVLTPLWTMSGWFLLPVVLLRPQEAIFSRVDAIRTTALVVAITIGALIAAPLLAWRYHRTGTQQGREYFRSMSAEVTNTWRLATALPLRIVMGQADLAEAITFYSPDHPDSVPNFDLAGAPWVTPDRLRRDGFATVCMTDDEPCVEAARREAAGKAGTQVVTFATGSRYFGDTGKLGRFTFILVPPQGTSPPLAR
jgi:hypothetical protein